MISFLTTIGEEDNVAKMNNIEFLRFGPFPSSPM